jgi:AcrR family transcriptional regulator
MRGAGGRHHSKNARPDRSLVRQPGSPPGGRSRLRSEQQRSIETRLAILEASLAEFADKGFEGASMRVIGERTGLHFTLITYHFKNKDKLWRATAEHFFKELAAIWELSDATEPEERAVDQVRAEFRAILRFQRIHPDFHHFMVRESRDKSPRFTWLMETVLNPVMRRIVPHIERAQQEGDFPSGNPVFILYLLIGLISAPSALGAEIRYNAGADPNDELESEHYWALVDQIIFQRAHVAINSGCE